MSTTTHTSLDVVIENYEKRLAEMKREEQTLSDQWDRDSDRGLDTSETTKDLEACYKRQADIRRKIDLAKAEKRRRVSGDDAG